MLNTYSKFLNLVTHIVSRSKGYNINMFCWKINLTKNHSRLRGGKVGVFGEEMTHGELSCTEIE